MALGRSDVFLKLEIIKKAMVLAVLLSTFRLGVFTWMAISAFTLGPFSVIVNSWPNRKLLNYTIGMQLRDVMPTAFVCLAEAAVVFGIDITGDILKPMFGVAGEGACLMASLGVKLLLQLIFGVGTFLGLAYAFRLKPMGEYACMAADVLKGRFPRISAAIERRFAT